jgi:hypothetical protein
MHSFGCTKNKNKNSTSVRMGNNRQVPATILCVLFLCVHDSHVSISSFFVSSIREMLVNSSMIQKAGCFVYRYNGCSSACANVMVVLALSAQPGHAYTWTQRTAMPWENSTMERRKGDSDQTTVYKFNLMSYKLCSRAPLWNLRRAIEWCDGVILMDVARVQVPICSMASCKNGWWWECQHVFGMGTQAPPQKRLWRRRSMLERSQAKVSK